MFMLNALNPTAEKDHGVLVKDLFFPTEADEQKITCLRPQSEYYFHVSGLLA